MMDATTKTYWECEEEFHPTECSECGEFEACKRRQTGA